MTQSFPIETFQSESFQNQLGGYWMRVADQVQSLNRLVFLEWASSRIIAGWVPAAPELAWKCEMTHIMWHQMTFAEQLRSRKEELAGNSKVTIPSAALEALIQNISRADTFMAFMAGWFLEFNRSMMDAYERLQEALDPIFDAPTIELLQDIIPKKRKHNEWARLIVHEAVKQLELLQSVNRFRTYVRASLLYAGGVDEKQETFGGVAPLFPITEPLGPAPRKRAKPNNVKTTDEFIPPVEVADNLKIFMWHYMTEIQVVDPMCYVFFGLSDMPFEFYCDFSRHIWDETRHHQMGVRRLQQMGFDTSEFAIPYGDDAIHELENYYSELSMVGETCSFTRKKKSMETYYEKGDILSGMTAEIDIIDERSHVKFGKKWIPVMHKNRSGHDQSLDEIIREIMNRWIDQDQSGLGSLQGNPELAKLPEEEKRSIKHFAFCSKIEFKDLNFGKL
ncbi:hypothetical protein A8709_28920 [Paenibacillus pectinilyticus]|uniref:DUF455 domain-containing protein n=1 Tax=Paenibacillus pectinilyticus TaxID=512399 RepID=A0A1C0ZUW0_9BACL|nr:DUF455 family protein [Paenibacillus pectinilyticus]OCT11889.1 hypothetical protein A8709_28920 [Paenibacillus pectinilyticus]